VKGGMEAGGLSSRPFSPASKGPRIGSALLEDGAKQEEEGEIERGNCRPDSVTEHDWALRRPRFF